MLSVHGGACNAILQEAQTHSEPVSKKEKEKKNPQTTTTRKQSIKLKWTAHVMGHVSSPSWCKAQHDRNQKTK